MGHGLIVCAALLIRKLSRALIELCGHFVRLLGRAAKSNKRVSQVR